MARPAGRFRRNIKASFQTRAATSSATHPVYRVLKSIRPLIDPTSARLLRNGPLLFRKIFSFRSNSRATSPRNTFWRITDLQTIFCRTGMTLAARLGVLLAQLPPSLVYDADVAARRRSFRDPAPGSVTIACGEPRPGPRRGIGLTATGDSVDLASWPQPERPRRRAARLRRRPVPRASAPGPDIHVSTAPSFGPRTNSAAEGCAASNFIVHTIQGHRAR